MFQTRLAVAFASLAVLAVLQVLVGGASFLAAERRTVESRLSSEILQGFLDLQANKQRLRAWMAQASMGLPVDPVERQVLYQAMLTGLDQLDSLAQRADEAGQDTLLGESRRRREALRVLRRGTLQLGDFLPSASLALAVSPEAAWDELNKAFDLAEGTDLRTVLSESIFRERLSAVRNQAEADASRRWALMLGLGASSLLLLLSLGSAVHFGRALRRPLGELIRGAEALESGDLDHRIEAVRYQEFARLARSMNAMAEEISRLRQSDSAARLEMERQVADRTQELQQALHQLEKTELRRRQLFADITHELKTPTTAIRGEAEVTLRGRAKSTEEYQEALRYIVEYSIQLSTVVDDILTLARTDLDMLVLERRRLPIHEFLKGIAQTAEQSAQRRGIPVVQLLEAQGEVLGDAERLRQLIGILVDNALDYSLPGPRAELVLTSVLISPAQGAPLLQVSVQDRGIGIPPDELHRVFDRHYRSSEARRLQPEGEGLGLALAAALGRAHGGSLRLESRPGGGTTAILLLPTAERPSASDSGQAP